MNRLLSLLGVIVIATAASAPAAAQTQLNGAGASFPNPLYSKWFFEYGKVNPDVRINYQSIGSGGGIRQTIAKTVDFGATDGPMTDAQLKEAPGAILHLPTVLGAVSVIYNLPGSPKLKLNGPVLADIFLGKVAKWNDPAIASLNPGVALPGDAIAVVHRSDGSGTTFCFVDYLSKVSEEWKTKVGTGTSVNWPVGLGGKGNEGVAGTVKQTPFSIGYVELIYALQNKLGYASVKNAAGKFVEPSVEAVTAAAAGTANSLPADFRVSITDAAGDGAYPISTYTWLLVYEKNDGEKGKLIAGFLKWMLDEGQKMAPGLGYAPLPDAVSKKVRDAIARVK
jgi:phosphate transport system substrate-binding protein